MHVVTKPRPEVLTVTFQGKVYEVTMTENGAHVPPNLGEHMLATGLVARGHEPDLKPQWEMRNGAWGDAIPMYQNWVREVPRSDVDETAAPEAVAKILEQKYRR
jgi:hypothetical protein